MEEKKMSLSEFINENDKLLTALGILTSIVIFANSLPLKLISAAFSFIFLFLTILVWLELWRKFPQKGSELLTWFENYLQYGFMVLVVYWVVTYRNFLSNMVPVLVAALVVRFLSKYVKDRDMFNRVFRTKKNGKQKLRYIVGIIAPYIVLFVVGGIFMYLKPIYLAILDGLYKALK